MGEAQHSTADAWKGSAHLLDVGDGVPWKAVLATLCRQEAPPSGVRFVLISVPAHSSCLRLPWAS